MKEGPRSWTRVVLAGARTSDLEERVSGRLEAMGSLGWEVRDLEILAYFDGAAASAESPQGAVLAEAFPELVVRIESVDEEAWADAHRAHFPPGRVGPFLVAPPWNTPRPGPEEITLVIDPGLAFGTGAHATTRACLSLVARHAGAGTRVLDLGTGSGILALAAARRGSFVTALDTDADAVREARKAFDAHGVEVDLRQGGIDALGDTARFDLLLANLAGEIHMGLCFLLPPRLAPDGVLVLAGILVEEEDRIRRAYEKRLATEAVHREGEWVAIVLRAPE